jgi:hypothetical protein
MTHSLILKRLTRYPKAASGDELLFGLGVNVMAGDKDSGKTTWLRMLDYLFGSDDKPAEAFGAAVATAYESIEALIELGDEKVVLRRTWTASAPRTKMLWNEEPINISELSDRLLEKLGIPRLHFPKGDPYAERAWPALSFRTLLRHIYRQERFWSAIAEKQWDGEQHACIALFLGVAESLFPPKFGELVEKQKLLAELQAKRAAYQLLLDQIAADLLRQKEMTVAVTSTALDETEVRLKAELIAINEQRIGLIKGVEQQVQTQLDARMQAAKTQLEELNNALQVASKEEGRVFSRLSELRPYAKMLGDELARFARAESTSDSLAQLRVTHCPVCDQEVTAVSNGHDCYLCHRPHTAGSYTTGKQRVAFEQTQLKEEQGEIATLLETLESKATELRFQIGDIQRQKATVESELLPAREMAMTLLPPDLALLSQAQGRINEQLETLARVRKSVQSQQTLAEEIGTVTKQEEVLKSELASTKGIADLEGVSRLFEERLNDYLNAINVDDTARWTHGRVGFQLKSRSFSFTTNEKLGATSQALFLFAYHYALLSLVADGKFFYPGFVILDFPLNLADGATIRDKENYLVEPFVKLCGKPEMKNTQVIAAGHSFDNLKGAHLLAIRRPPLAS